MADRRKQKKSVRKKHRSNLFQNLNIGTVIFGCLFLYMIVSLFFYMKADHIRSYQVVKGPLSRNETYTALALRSENVIHAQGNGYVHFYTGNCSKVSRGSIVYSLSSENTATETKGKDLDSKTKKQIRSSLSRFSRTFDPTHFSDLYPFESELSAQLISGISSDTGYEGQTMEHSEEDGIVVYGSDGYEDFTEDNLTKEVFEQNKKYEYTDSPKEVSSGDPVYRLIDDEEWKLVIPVSEKKKITLSEYQSLKVKFQKDGETQMGTVSFLQKEDQNYLVLTLQNGLIRYADDRFLEVELVTNTGTGLKIPNSAITKKDFFTVPAEFAANGDDSDQAGFLRIRKDKKGNIIPDENGQPTTEFISAVFYEKVTDDAGNPISYYVDPAVLQEGDLLVATDSARTYQVGAKAQLEGVYCINKGYAVFRKIQIIDHNEEFCIIRSQTDFGISEYDYIVEDASMVSEDQIMH